MEEKNNDIKPIVDHAIAHNIPVAAICGATFFMGENGYLDNRKHSSNTLEFTREIMLYLNAKPADKINEWYKFHKLGKYYKDSEEGKL